MERKSAILLSIMLVVGSLVILPMSGSGATEHLFEAYDEATSTPMINNATDSTHPNDGLARMYNQAAPDEYAGGTFPDPAYPNTNDIVGMGGNSQWNNSFHLDTQGFNNQWFAGDTFVFTVETDPGSSLIPMIYDGMTTPNGYVASASLVATIDELQVVGPMDLTKLPLPYFSAVPPDYKNYTVNWSALDPMDVPNIGTYVIYNSSIPDGGWSIVEEVAAPPSTVYADSGAYYSLGINWTDGMMGLVQSAPNQFNTVPDLNWTGTGEYVSDGVAPDSGPVNCRDFEFKVKYSDPNNDAPGSLPVLHILENGIPYANKTMEFDSWVLTTDNWAEGAIYRNVTQLTNPTAVYSYYFSGNDSFGTPAIGLGTIVTLGPSVADNLAPSVDVLVPNGGQVWTGGANKTITMTVTDEDSVSPGFNMSLTLKYSTNNGATYPDTIITRTGYPSVLGMHYWDPLPLINSFQVRVRAEFTDSCGVMGSDDSDASFEIDSIPPDATITPDDGAVDVDINTNIVIEFDEGMNQASAEAAISLVETDTGTPVSYATSWDGDELTLDPLAPLDQYTNYTVTINATALDDSDPGNPLPITTSTFRTEDLEAPVIVHTELSDQETGDTITVTADVTDNVDVDTVTLSWGWIGETPTVIAMSPTTGDTFSVGIGPLSREDSVQYTITATDPSGNSATTPVYQFEVTKAGCPITGGIADPDGKPIDGAKVEILDGSEVIGSATTVTGIFIISDLPCGQYTLKVTKDGFADYSATIDTNDGLFYVEMEPSFPLWIIIVIIVIIVVVIILLLLLLKRRKKPEEEEAEEELPEEEEAPAEEMEETEEEVLDEGAEDELAELEEVLEEAEEKK